MSYPKTPVIGLQTPDNAGIPGARGGDYADIVTNDQTLSSSLSNLDAFAGLMSASCYSIFGPSSGSLADLLAGGNNDGFGAEFTRTDRVIQEVVAWVANTGSGGVTTVDVLIQQGAVQPANFASIFQTNATRPCISGGLGGTQAALTIGPSGSSKTFVSGSTMLWPAGTLMQVKMTTAAGASGASLSKASGLTVQVFWKPSASFYAGA